MLYVWGLMSLRTEKYRARSKRAAVHERLRGKRAQRSEEASYSFASFAEGEGRERCLLQIHATHPQPFCVLDGLLEPFAGAKGGYLRRRDPHLLLGLRVDALPGLLLANVELPKAGDLNFFPAPKRLGYDLLTGVHIPLSLAPGRVGPFGYLLDKLSLIHVVRSFPLTGLVGPAEGSHPLDACLDARRARFDRRCPPPPCARPSRRPLRPRPRPCAPLSPP